MSGTPPGLFTLRWMDFMSTFDPSNDLVDLTGKVAIVTGGNRGVGYWTVLYLRRRGAKVYLCARDEAKARAAIDAMTESDTGVDDIKAGEVVFLKMDLVDPKQVHSAASSVLELESRVDIIVNNAAIGFEDYQETHGGLSKHMVVNHISHFLLVRTLSPLLEAAAKEEGSDVRVVTVSSSAHLNVTAPDIKFDTIESLNRRFPGKTTFDTHMGLYAYTKLANILMSKELQRRYDAQGIPITCISLHPGYIYTDEGFTNFSDTMPDFVIRTFLKTVCINQEKGSFTNLFAAASPEVRSNPHKYRGAYLMPYDSVSPTSSLADDTALAEALWTTTEKALKEVYQL